MHSSDSAGFRTSEFSLMGLSGFYTGNGHKIKLPSTAADSRLKYPSCHLV